MYLLNVMSSVYCKTVFAITFFSSYFLLPNGVWEGVHRYIAFIFMLTFSFSISCIVRNIKEKIVVAHKYKTSVFSLVLSVLGFSAFQVCGINAGMCTATAGLGLVSTVFPGFFLAFLSDYAYLIIWFSALFQVITLYFMKCFERQVYRYSE